MVLSQFFEMMWVPLIAEPFCKDIIMVLHHLFNIIISVAGHFMYTEASGEFRPSQSLVAVMQTEPALKHNSNQVCVRFWYHMYGSLMGNLSVQFMVNGNRKTVWKKSGKPIIFFIEDIFLSQGPTIMFRGWYWIFFQKSFFFCKSNPKKDFSTEYFDV